MKKALSLFVAILVFSVSVCAAPVVDLTEEKTLIRGVTYKNIKGLYQSGWQDIHIVTADLNEKHLSLEVLRSSQGESYTQNTLVSAEKNGSVAAVNADFFSAKRGEAGRGSATGVEIRDGELYSSASVAESMNTVYKLLGENGFHIDAFAFDITLNAANGKQDKIKLINKYDDLTGIVMYTSDWAEKSVGSVGGIIEVSVDKNGKVLEKVTEQEPIEIPKDGYVLSAHMSYNTFLLDNVQIGDKITIDINSVPDYKKIETAVGGGGVLLCEGIAQTAFSHTISGKNPRTAIGIDKTGKIITLVVLDGRRDDARGMTQIELAELMKELGCYNALNFDGGGSSVMVTDVAGAQTVMNTPSDGGLRNVANSLAVMSSVESETRVTSLAIQVQGDIIAGQPAKVKVLGKDKYLREKTILNEIVYTTNNGIITDGVWTPEHEGYASITASANGLSKTEHFSVGYIKTTDEQNTKKEVGESGYRFAIFGNTKSNDTMFDKFVMNKATLRMQKNSDFQYVLGGDVNEKTLTHIQNTFSTAKKYNCETKNGDTFITVPNASSKIYIDDTSVWSEFSEDVKKSTGNLFVFLDRNFISENETEVKLFKDILESEAKERNVYVFGGGFVNKFTVENDVRYVNTAGFFQSVALEGTSIDYIEYVLVTVNGAEVTYEYRKAVR